MGIFRYSDIILMKIKLSTWARDNGIHHKTAYRWYKNGKMPYPTYKIGPKTIVVEVPDEDSSEDKTVIYSRVSSHDQKEDLERQIGRILQYAVEQGIEVDSIEKEISSGLNENRPKLNRILQDPTIKHIIVEHKDRIGRHNITPIISALKATGRKVTIINKGEVKDDLVADVLSLLTSYAAKIYGKKSAKNRAKKAVEQLSLPKEDDNNG